MRQAPMAHTTQRHHTTITGGTPAWQVTLIAVAAVALAAGVAVTIYRVWAARQRATAAA
jgi:hypothetical protein